MYFYLIEQPPHHCTSRFSLVHFYFQGNFRTRMSNSIKNSVRIEINSEKTDSIIIIFPYLNGYSVFYVIC